MSRRKQSKPLQIQSPTGKANDTDSFVSDQEKQKTLTCEAEALSEPNEKNIVESNSNRQQLDNNSVSKQEIDSDVEQTENSITDDHTTTVSSEKTDENILKATGESDDIIGGISPVCSNMDVNIETLQTSVKTSDNEPVNEDRDGSLNESTGDDEKPHYRSGNISNEEIPNESFKCRQCGDNFPHIELYMKHKKLVCPDENTLQVPDYHDFSDRNAISSTYKETLIHQETKNERAEALNSDSEMSNMERSGNVDNAHKDEQKMKDENDNFESRDSPDINMPPQAGFLNSAAIANVIKTMQSLESGLASEQQIGEDGKPTGKLDINGIKDQVKMIQQQQAYQIQMLNYLHWQLAVLSSNPQAAMQVASTMRNAFPGGLPGQNPGMPPMFSHGQQNGGSQGIMPQMMAAMAMNGGNGGAMDMAVKARMMMNMQGSGSQHFRSMLGHGRSLSRDENTSNEHISSPTFDPHHEQRYQLQEPPNMEKMAQIQRGENNSVPSSPVDCKVNRSPSVNRIPNDMLKQSIMPLNGLSEESMRSRQPQDVDCNSNSSFKDDSSENSAYRHRCKFCQKVFGSDSALQIHLRSHTGERPYKCNICGNRFTTKGNLKVHFMRHKAKYPHIPMNPHPVPEYLDGVPTTNGLPYGMSILPEKAVFERPRLHGNPSIHLSPHHTAALAQQNQQTHSRPNPFFPYPKLSPEQAKHLRPGFPVNGSPETSIMQEQLLERQRQIDMMERRKNSENESEESRVSPRGDQPSADSKPSATMLQAAMMPFFRFGKHPEADFPENMKSFIPHGHTLLDGGNSDGRSSYSSSGSSSPPHSNGHRVTGDSSIPSETSKLQRLVENIDRGRVLQKNECHICHRVLSCQSALKLHYRTHTGERPHKCDLCSRAFTTRGNLRTHYSSVHRQQLRALPPGGASRPGSYPCPLCHMRFFDVMEFQRHMQTHAMMQEKSQEVPIGPQKGSPIFQKPENLESPENLELPEDEKVDEKIKEDPMEFSSEDKKLSVEDEDSNLQIDENVENEDTTPVKEEAIDIKKDDDKDDDALDLSSPNSVETGKDSNNNPKTSEAVPMQSLKALSNLTTSNVNSWNESMDRPPLNRSRSRDAVCEICEKTFACKSALEIHLRSHTKERPFVCRICQKGFTTKGNLKQHLLMHNITDVPDEMLEPMSSPEGASASNSPIGSPVSLQRDPSSPSLKRSFDSDSSNGHMQHGGPPPKQRQYPRHWCHICQKQFSSASSLQIHTRTHTGEKPFACSVCGRAFTTKGNLKVHMGTHVFGAGGSRRGRRISMDNPLISPWMKSVPQGQNPALQMPAPAARPDPALLYQQYAALANGLLAGKPDMDASGIHNNRLLAMNAAAGLLAQSSSSPTLTSSRDSNSPPMRLGSAGMANPAMTQAATEWFLKAYQQRAQEPVN